MHEATHLRKQLALFWKTDWL